MFTVETNSKDVEIKPLLKYWNKQGESWTALEKKIFLNANTRHIGNKKARQWATVIYCPRDHKSKIEFKEKTVEGNIKIYNGDEPKRYLTIQLHNHNLPWTADAFYKICHFRRSTYKQLPVCKNLGQNGASVAFSQREDLVL